MSISIAPPSPSPSTPPASSRALKFEVWYQAEENLDGATPYGTEYDRADALALCDHISRTFKCPAWILPARKHVRRFPS